MNSCQKQKGSVLIISMIFVCIFATFAVCMSQIADSNAQIASNHRQSNYAFTSAESGLEIVRFWLNRISISATTAESERFNVLNTLLQNDLAANCITNITPIYCGSTITIPNATVESGTGQSFSAEIRQINPEVLQLDVTGIAGEASRTIRVNYNIGTQAHAVFDYGVATKGALHLAGNIELEGANVAVEASVYIESENSDLALSITGNSQIAGDVSITNPDGYVELQGGQAGIGGETGQAAIDNHVSVGVAPTGFPAPNPAMFESFVQNTIDETTDTSTDASFENVRIAAGTNPTFSGDVTLKGIVFIETPNIVTFSGNTTITGIIVGDGDIGDNSGVNQINFLGNVDSYSVAELPDEDQFISIKEQTGTFALAPGFKLSFGGTFDALNGAIAANGIEFFGNAGGTINGSVINYSDEVMTLTGTSDLYFNRSGTTEIPAGFVPEIVLEYDAGSYSEVIL